MNIQVPSAIVKIAPHGELTARQKRRFLIDLSLRRQKPGSGSSVAFLKERTAMNPWPDFRQILKSVPWVIVGGVATRAYMPERMTKDMDILIRKEDGQRVVDIFLDAGFEVISELAIPGYLLQAPDGVQIDLLLGAAPWLQTALANPQQDRAGYPVIDLPYLVLMKLDAMRAQDWADITRMLGWANEDELDAVRAAVAAYSPEDSEDLESLIFIGQKEREQAP